MENEHREKALELSVQAQKEGDPVIKAELSVLVLSYLQFASQADEHALVVRETH